MMSTAVTNRPKLSAWTTPKLEVFRFHKSAEAIAAPTRPIAPRGPIGIRSPGDRNASATIAAMAAAVTHNIGTMAFSDIIGTRDARSGIHSGREIRQGFAPPLLRPGFRFPPVCEPAPAPGPG